jgi:hypothetical protein
MPGRMWPWNRLARVRSTVARSGSGHGSSTSEMTYVEQQGRHVCPLR